MFLLITVSEVDPLLSNTKLQVSGKSVCNLYVSFACASKFRNYLKINFYVSITFLGNLSQNNTKWQTKPYLRLPCTVGYQHFFKNLAALH